MCELWNTERERGRERFWFKSKCVKLLITNIHIILSCDEREYLYRSYHGKASLDYFNFNDATIV